VDIAEGLVPPVPAMQEEYPDSPVWTMPHHPSVR
jgi:hypothetical protein